MIEEKRKMEEEGRRETVRIGGVGFKKIREEGRERGQVHGRYEEEGKRGGPKQKVR